MLRINFAIARLLLLTMLVTACSGPAPDSPEQAVRDTLEAIELAAEARSVGGVLQHVSDDYRDHQGMLKKDLSNVIRLHYLRNQRIHIYSRINSLEINGNTATAEIYAAMSARESLLQSEQGRLKADTLTFSVVLGSSDGQRTWLVESVIWERGWR